MKIWNGFQIPLGFPTKTYAENWCDSFPPLIFTNAKAVASAKRKFKKIGLARFPALIYDRAKAVPILCKQNNWFVLFNLHYLCCWGKFPKTLATSPKTKFAEKCFAFFSVEKHAEKIDFTPLFREQMPIKMLTHAGQSNDPNKIVLPIYFWQWRIWTPIFWITMQASTPERKAMPWTNTFLTKVAQTETKNTYVARAVFPFLWKHKFDAI